MQTIEQQKKNIEEYRNKLEASQKANAELETKLKEIAMNVRDFYLDSSRASSAPCRLTTLLTKQKSCTYLGDFSTSTFLTFPR